jgi:hypothetical protein
MQPSERAASAASGAAAAATGSSCFSYGDVVTFRFNLNNRFMAAEDDGAVNINRMQALQWERFLLVNPDNTSYAGAIPVNGVIALRTYKHNNYLQTAAGAAVRADSRILNAASRWRLSSTAPCVSSGGSVNVTGRLVTEDQSRVVEPLTPADRAMTMGNFLLPRGWGQVLVTRVSMWDFYYDVPWRSWHNGAEDCPYRGRYDGASCFVAKSIYPQPFVWQGNFYGDAAWCPLLGWFDNAHCQIGVNPPGSHTPFIHQNGWYLGKGLYEGMQCVDAESSSPYYGDVKGCGRPWAIQVGSFPKSPISQTVNAPVPLWEIAYFRICYKKKNTLAGICDQEMYYSGTYVKDITGLQANKTYKIRAYYQRTIGTERLISQIEVGTH